MNWAISIYLTIGALLCLFVLTSKTKEVLRSGVRQHGNVYLVVIILLSALFWPFLLFKVIYDRGT